MTVYSLLIDSDTVYAATYPNGDVFKSIDGCNSWVPTAELPGVTAVRGIARLQNGDILIGTSPYDTQLENRIFRTSDGGVSWTVTASLQSINPCTSIYQTANGTVFAGGWGIDSYITLWRSADNGVTWDNIDVIQEEHCEWSVDAFLETSGDSLYVSGWHPAWSVGDGGGFVCLSTDNGLTWTECAKIIRADGVHNCRVYDMVEDHYGTVYVGMQPAYDQVVFRTTDGGQTWQTTGGLDGAYECLCLLRASDGTIYAGTTPNGDVFRLTPTGIEESWIDAPGYVSLDVFPNPCLDYTNISFSLPAGSYVTLAIFDSLGRRVSDLTRGQMVAGRHSIGWDLRSGTGRIVSSGVYYCRLRTQTDVSIYKFVVFNR
jgi:hypothetical protein